MKGIKEDFPILKEISYLDNAATTQKPRIVIDALKEFYENNNANPHRAIYSLSANATKMLDDARKRFADFINAKPYEIIFVRNATEGFNQIATSIERSAGRAVKNANIVITEIEHHSNFLPWQQLCLRKGWQLRVAGYDARKNDVEAIDKLVDKNTLIVSFTMMSNVSGLMTDAAGIIKKIKKKNRDAIIILDATQYVAHSRLDARKIDADFIVFSAHKIYGTTGVGAVYGKKDILRKIGPFFFGGNMISDVSIKKSEWADIPEKFEAGTLDTPGIYASAKGIDYLLAGFKDFMKLEENLKRYALKRLRRIKGLKIIGHDRRNYGPVISFVIQGVHPHDLATICDRHNVCIRSGHHCALPFMRKLGVAATSRASISFYNTTEDIDRLIGAIEDAKGILKV